MYQIMLDIETFSSSKESLIVSVAAVSFKSDKGTDDLTESDIFYRKVDFSDPDIKKFNIDVNTILWWFKQNEKVRNEAFLSKDNRWKIRDVLIGLKDFINSKGRDPIIYNKGIDFDSIILENAYSVLNIEVPWKFYNKMDSRTLMKFFDIKNEDLVKNLNGFKEVDAHNPVYDCLIQINCVKIAYDLLHNKK